MKFTAASQVQIYLTEHPEARAEYAQRDTTGEWFDHHSVWLDESGELVQNHPTDSRRGPIAAPAEANYRVVL
jgi:hypothetical protein